MDATTVAVDLAKDVFEVALANRAYRIVDRRRLTRRQFESFVDGLGPGTTVVMEACGTAHYWAAAAKREESDPPYILSAKPVGTVPRMPLHG